MHCALNWLLKRETQKWFYSLSLSSCVILKTQGFSLIFKHFWGYSTFFRQISDESTWYLRYWVHSFDVGVHSTWFQEYGVHGFGGTGVQGTEYIVSHYPPVCVFR